MESTNTSTNNIPVVFCPAGDDACAFYRMKIPHMSLENSDYYFGGWEKTKVPKSLDMRRLVGRRVVVVQRQSSEHNLAAIRTMKSLGLKVVYDLDDNVWNLPAGNPAKKAFMENKAGFAACAKEADILTVSTVGLKTAVTTGFIFNKEIYIVPNAMNFDLFKPKELEKDGILIGWGGSNTHTADQREMMHLLCEILNQYPQVQVEIAGAVPKKQASEPVKVLDVFKNEDKKKSLYTLKIEIIRTKQVMEIPWSDKDSLKLKGHIIDWKGLVDSEIINHERYRFRNWVPTREYPNRFASWGWDITLAPLEDVRFNESKSNIKMLEAAAIKVPCLVSAVKPYIEFCALGKDLNWLLCRNEEDWKSKLTCLINEPERRQYLGQRMYETAKKYFDIETIRHSWMWVFQKALQC